MQLKRHHKDKNHMGIHKVNREQSCDVSTRVKEDDICYISYYFLHFQQLENPLCESLSYDAPINTPSVGILIFYDTSTHPVSEVTDERHLWSGFSEPLQCTLSYLKPWHCNMNGFTTPYATLICIDGKELFMMEFIVSEPSFLYVAITFHT